MHLLSTQCPACCMFVQYNLLGVMDEERIRLREEVNEQIRALDELKEMAASYGDDVSKPATNSREAVQVCCAGLMFTHVHVHT